MEMMKVNDLREVVGRVFNDNRSSTLRSELVSVSKCGQVCVVKEVPSPYAFVKSTPKPGMKKQPSWLTWNSIFY
jgi:hypothetical protein